MLASRQLVEPVWDGDAMNGTQRGAAPVTDTDTVSRLRTALARVSRSLRRTAASSGLTPTQLSILGTVSRAGSLRLSDLAAHEGVNPTMLSRIVGRLDELGLVARAADPDDRRAVHVQVTSGGEALHQRIRAERDSALLARLEALDPHHAASLLAAIPALEVLAAGKPAASSVPVPEREQVLR
jgi:DNA-binding MarR family transcriptional regulator